MSFFQEQENLSSEERAIRDAFVDEFFFDFQPYRSCLRLGFEPELAYSESQKYMTEAYVLQQIRKRMEGSSVSTESEIEKDKSIIINALRDTIQNGNHPSRVAAARQLSELRGFTTGDPDDTSELLINAFRKIAGEVE